MRRKRVTARFYVFLVLLLIGGYFILRELLPEASREAVVTLANASYTREVQAVIVRDETVTSYEGNARVDYIAEEGAAITQGQDICDVYPAGYSEKEIAKLETVRQNIRTYHESILSNIVDTQLEQLESDVTNAALRVKTLIRQKSGGSLINLQRQLMTAMQERQNYLRQNRREDPKLNSLYEEELKRESTISSWKTSEKASRDGVVSFYVDGCESFLTPANLSAVTVDDVRAILAGRVPQSEASRLLTPIYRIVSNDKWYIILLSGDTSWNPVSGQVFTFQLEGYEDIAYTGTVIQMQKTETEVMAQLEINAQLGPLINKRYGKASIGVALSGLSVPIGAVTTQSGQTGVILSDMAGGTFIPVEVLSSDSRYALVQPLVEGTLFVGQRILVN